MIGIIIEEFDSSRHDITILTDLLHQSYQRLYKMGLNYTACRQTPDMTLRRLQRGVGLVVLNGTEIIGTVTLYLNQRESVCDWYQLEKVGSFGQFAIDPKYQSRGIGSYLLNFVEQKAQELELTELALDTSEKATHLLEFYQRRGYRKVGFVQWENVNYRSIVMSKTLGKTGKLEELEGKPAN